MQEEVENQSRLKLWIWLGSLYVKTKPLFFVWQVIKSIYDGVRPIVYSFLTAKFLASIPAVIAQHKNSSSSIKYLIIIGVVELATQLINQFDTLIRNRFANIVQIKMHELYIHKLYSLSQEQFDEPELTARLPKAQDALFGLYMFFGNIFWLLSAVFSFIGSLIAIVFVSPLVGLLIAVSIIPTVLVDYKMNKRRHADDLYTDKFGRMAWRSRYTLEDPLQMPEIRVIRAYTHLLKVWRENSLKLFDRNHQTNRWGFKLYFISNAFESTVSLAANLWFLRLAIAGSIGFDKFLFVRGLLQNTASSGNTIASTVQLLHRDLLNFENLRTVLLTEPVIKDGEIKLHTDQLVVKFIDVSFRYPSTDSYALKNINLTMSSDSKIALVGENGAGKSTIIKLLLRQYLPTSGTITVNDIPIQDLSSEDYYQHISTLFQDYKIFPHLTIGENIAIGSPTTSTEEAIVAAAKLAGIHGTIKKLKNGYAQRLSSFYDDGSGLSGGQEQRIGIARALLRKSALLILDEPTSAIDAKAEYQIFNNIYKAHEGKATLIVSHRFSTVRRADLIMLLKDGAIVESGSHAELIAKNGFYKEMFDLQAEGYR